MTSPRRPTLVEHEKMSIFDPTAPYRRPAWACKCGAPDCTGWRQDVDLGGGHMSYRQFCELIEAHWAYLEDWRSEHGAHTALAHG